MSWQHLAIGTRAAIVLAGLSFFVTLEQSRSNSVNGVLTACEYTDYGALIFGVLAILAALIGAAMRQHSQNLLFAGAAGLAGAYSTLSGLGLIGSTCG